MKKKKKIDVMARLKELSNETTSNIRTHSSLFILHNKMIVWPIYFKMASRIVRK